MITNLEAVPADPNSKNIWCFKFNPDFENVYEEIFTFLTQDK